MDSTLVSWFWFGDGTITFPSLETGRLLTMRSRLLRITTIIITMYSELYVMEYDTIHMPRIGNWQMLCTLYESSTSQDAHPVCRKHAGQLSQSPG